MANELAQPEYLQPIVIPSDNLKRFLRVVVISLAAVALAIIATFRTFGFDYTDGGAKDLYPYVADGWGIWYWFAQLRLNIDFYFLVIHVLFAAQILTLAFPRKRKFALSISVAIFAYMTFWFLFGQARYGMAVALLATGALMGSTAAVIFLGVLAFLIHKALIGGVFLILLWRVLQRARFGLLISAALSGVLSFAVFTTFQAILSRTGYENYLNWESLPGANTPFKFYYLLAVFLGWKFYDRKMPDKLLILTLLFLPFSYFIVFAGRAFEIYIVLLLACLVRMETPKLVRYAVAALLFADVGVLLFNSGFYF